MANWKIGPVPKCLDRQSWTYLFSFGPHICRARVFERMDSTAAWKLWRCCGLVAQQHLSKRGQGGIEQKTHARRIVQCDFCCSVPV